MQKLGKHLVMKKLLKWISPTKVIQWILVNRRFYLKFIPSIIRALCIFKRRGIKIITNLDSIELFSQTRLKWEPLLDKHERESGLENFEGFVS